MQDIKNIQSATNNIETQIDKQTDDYYKALALLAASWYGIKTLTLTDITNEVNNVTYEYITNINNILNDNLQEIVSSIKTMYENKGFKIDNISEKQLESITSFLNSAKLEINGFIESKKLEITSKFFQLTQSNLNKNEYLSQVEKILSSIGNSTSLRGVKVLIITKVNSFVSFVSKVLANKFNIKKFLYYGPVDSKTRDWCRKWAGSVLTLEEIKSWANKSWQGKSPGDPFVERGGYNCRHLFIPYKGDK